MCMGGGSVVLGMCDDGVCMRIGMCGDIWGMSDIFVFPMGGYVCEDRYVGSFLGMGMYGVGIWEGIVWFWFFCLLYHKLIGNRDHKLRPLSN